MPRLLQLLLFLLAASVSWAQSATSGRVVVYTALEDDQLVRYLASFRETYPDIRVDLVRDSTGIITARLLAEGANPQADVVWGLAATSLLVLEGEGLLEPFAPAGLDRVAMRLRDEATPPTWVGIDAYISAFCVNTIELAAFGLPMPASWADLVDPVYRGHVVMPNPNSSGTGFLSVSAILQLQQPGGVAAFDGPIDALAGWQYLDALHANIGVYTHSGSKPCRVAGAGEYPIGISFGYRAIQQKASGEPIEGVFPTEGSGWEVEANALIRKPSINPAAQTFLDWAISDAVMAEYAQSFAITSVATSVPVPAGFPADPLAQLVANDFRWAAQHREAILAEWMRRYDGKSEPR